MDMTTYLVRVLYSSTTLPIYQVFGTRHPDTDPSNVTRVLFFVRNVRRRKASSSWVSDLHVRAPRSLEAKPEGLAGGRSPAGTVAPADVAIVRRCSISFHDGFRRKAHTSRTVVAFRAFFTKPNAVFAKPVRRSASIRRPSDARSSSSSLVAELPSRKPRKKTVRLARIHARASLFFSDVFVTIPKGTGPSHQAAARGFHSATRRSSARRAKRAYTGPSGKGDLLSSFRCGDAWKRRGDSLFVFLFFFPLGPGKLKRASTRRNRAAAFAVTTTLEAVC